jgi:eukaryotic-like serine/threonine-protein kinase
MIDHEDHALIMDFGIALSSDKNAKAKPAGPATVPPPADADGGATMMGASPSAVDSSATVLGSAPPATSAAVMKASRSGTILSTKTGGIVGTLEYMAPEQSKGEPVDQRTDIYAFGLILSDLILGLRKMPTGSTPWKELTTRVSQPPAPLRSKDPGLPEAIDALVTKCLQIDPAQRYQTTAELAAALNRLDDRGDLIPEPKLKRFTPRIAAAAALVVAALVGGTYWFARGPAAPPKPPDPVSVLIADFANNAQEPVFDGLIEQALAVGVEGATFVNAYPRRDALRLATQLKPGGHLDDDAAVLVALREGVDRVIGGAIDKAGGGYKLSLRIVNPADRKTLVAWDTTASGRDDVLAAVGRLATRAREGLGDRTASADKVKNEETFTAASLEAARAYTSGQELQWAGKYEEAFARYQQAVTLDPAMGRAYAGLGAAASSLFRRQEAEEYYKQALQRVGRMTDREKYRTRGGYYLLTRNIDKSREEFQSLIKLAPTDTAGLSNLALTEFYARNMPKALQLGLQTTKVFPKAIFYKNNAALYAMYAGDFAAAQKEAASVLEINPQHLKAFLTTALSQLATDHAADAAATYGKMAQLPGSARWLAANGLADLAMYEGRLADAAALLDAAVKDESNASRKARLVVTLGEVRNLQGRPHDAEALARQALALSTDEGLGFLAGRVLSEAGDSTAALEIVTRLLKRFDAESLAMARVLEGEIALKSKDPRKAIERFKTAQQFADTWLGRFGLGRAYLAAEAVAEADSEFDLCLKRRGEATAALLDDVPTYRLFAPVSYYKGRAQEALGSPDARQAYLAFLAIKQHADEQGLVADARKRVAAR